MKSMRVTDGDLDFGQSKRVDLVTGRDKLVQDLTLWLLEPIGTGFSTPGFGSLLNSIVTVGTNQQRQGRFIGQEFTEDIAVEVEAEIDRVLSLYQQDQVQKIREARTEGRLHLYSRREILDSIDDISSTSDGDRAIIKVAITTGANQDFTLLAQADTDEVQIAVS